MRGRKNVTVSQKTPGLSWPWDGSAVARKSAVLIRRDVGFFFFGEHITTGPGGTTGMVGTQIHQHVTN